MAFKPGSIWVEGQYFHHVDENGEEWRYFGDLITVGSPFKPGSTWPEGDFYHYVDEFGDERRMVGVDHGARALQQGSKWMESILHRWAWMDQNTLKRTAHVDDHSNAHGDATVPHVDSAHIDVPHADVPHSNSHSDTHGDTHGDVAHSNFAHTNTHGDHTDVYPSHVNWHGDTPHGDTAHTNTHTNTHANSHSDVAHTNVAHVDDHGDHNDHTNTHNDITHDDRPERVDTNTHIIFEVESRKRVRRRKVVYDY